jgi:hypothetical protein
MLYAVVLKYIAKSRVPVLPQMRTILLLLIQKVWVQKT